MTMAIVLASPNTIWACGDRRLTDSRTSRPLSSNGVKITDIGATNGGAFLTYAGIGQIQSTEVSRWVYQTLRGSYGLSLDELFQRISTAAQPVLLSTAKRSGVNHMFIAAAICDRKPCIYVLNQPMIVRKWEMKCDQAPRFDQILAISAPNADQPLSDNSR
jgi:hypothetical protein